MRIPDFFIAGAQKAGTTSMHDWLAQQPDVCLPTLKETHFFSHDQRHDKGLEWYLRQFPKCAEGSVMGEVDPEYMFHECAPAWIAEVCPEAKVVFILRSPLERAYSHYQMSVRRGFEPLSFYDALMEEEKRIGPGVDIKSLENFTYMGRGRYAAQIARFRRSLPGGSFLVVRFDEMVSPAAGDEVYGRICRFIGVKSSPSIADRSKKSNAASAPRSALITNLLYQKSLPRKVLKLLLPSHDLRMKLWAFTDRFNEKPLERSGTDKSPIPVPDFVVNEMKMESARLKEAEGLDCGDWLEKSLSGGRFVFTGEPAAPEARRPPQAQR